MEKPHILVGAGAVIIRGNETLLGRRKGSHGQGCYGSTGGHVEHGESPVEAVRREAREELGVELCNIRFVSCSNLLKYGKHYIDLMFVADIESGEPRVCEPDKLESIDWYPLDNLPHPLFESVRIALDSLQSGQVFHEISECE